MIGDVAGEEESPVYAILKMSEAHRQDSSCPMATACQALQRRPAREHRALSHEVGWRMAHHVEVFRDLGLAFAAVLVLIYVLVVGWFGSFKTPLVIMAPIPLTLVGILPAHALMGAFFTATSMIGFIAGAGIIVRNSIILVDFIELRRSQGMSLEEAVVDAGRGALPPHAAHRGGGGRRRQRDPVRSDLPGTGAVADGGRSGFDRALAHGGAGALLPEPARSQLEGSGVETLGTAASKDFNTEGEHDH